MRCSYREIPGSSARPDGLYARVRATVQALPWRLIGAAQVAGRVLVHVPPAATLGALAFAPVVARLFAVPLPHPVHGTPVVTGLMLLASLPRQDPSLP